jgi:hypothetical protein
MRSWDRFAMSESKLSLTTHSTPVRHTKIKIIGSDSEVSRVIWVFIQNTRLGAQLGVEALWRIFIKRRESLSVYACIRPQVYPTRHQEA